MSNRLLIKIALNAQKARAMAKKVGIIPDHESAWKYALRNLRNGRGEALEGKLLEEAKAKLGDIGHNTFKTFKKHDDSWHGRRGLEFTGDITSKGRLAGAVRKGSYHKVPNEVVGNIHSHPRYNGENKDMKKKEIPHRLAEPSGINKITRTPLYYEGGKFRSKNEMAFENIQKLTEHQKNRVFKLYKNIGEKNKTRIDALVHRAMTLPIRYTTKNRPIIGRFKQKHGIDDMYELGSADVGVFSRRFHEGKDKTIQRIVAPSEYTVSANKSSKRGLRTVYFDHSKKNK